MTGNKKVRCNVCYREMRSDNVKRHMKQHTKKNESNPVTNISVTNNYNTISGVSTERKDEENENKDAQTTIDEKALETSQAEQGHTRVPSSPSSNWTQSIQQSSNLLVLFN